MLEPNCQRSVINQNVSINHTCMYVFKEIDQDLGDILTSCDKFNAQCSS